MKVFWIKSINCILIAGIIMGYQYYAVKRDNEIKANEEENAKARQEWIESNKNTQVSKSSIYKNGVFEGTGKGFGGDIVVQVTIENDFITDAAIVSADNETPSYIDAASAILDDVVAKQTVKVDAVSGATLSSNGIIEGLENAIKEASDE